MLDTLGNYVGGVTCRGITINNQRFADDIDLIASNEEELKEITVKLDETSRKYGMGISTEKSKVMVAGKFISEQILVRVNGNSQNK